MPPGTMVGIPASLLCLYYASLGTPCSYPTLLGAYLVSVQCSGVPWRSSGLWFEINIGYEAQRGLPVS